MSRSLDDNQIEKLRNECRSQRDRAHTPAMYRQSLVMRMMLEFGLRAGFRVFEMVNLRVGDCQGQKILVRREKGGGSRVVFVGSDMASRIESFKCLKEAWRESLQVEAPFFVSERGTGFTTRGLQLKFKALAQSAGLDEDISIHALRHTYNRLAVKACERPIMEGPLANKANRAGWELLSLFPRMEMMGHDSLRGQSYYLDMLSSPLALIVRYFGGPVKNRPNREELVASVYGEQSVLESMMMAIADRL